MDINQYKNTIENSKTIIDKLNQQISTAEKDLIVAETQLKTEETAMERIKQNCISITGQPIEKLDEIIEQNMKDLEHSINEVNEIMASIDASGSIENSENFSLFEEDAF